MKWSLMDRNGKDLGREIVYVSECERERERGREKGKKGRDR